MQIATSASEEELKIGESFMTAINREGLVKPSDLTQKERKHVKVLEEKRYFSNIKIF